MARLRSAAGEFGNQRLAKIGPALAAVFGKEDHQCAELIDVGALDEVTPPLLGPDESSLRENGKMR
jgi:hypothetical protein